MTSHDTQMPSFSATTHTLLWGPAHECLQRFTGDVDLVVTSPPYPMISMWDEIFAAQDPAIARELARDTHKASATAFEAMHGILDQVWTALAQRVKSGGLVCINIGDAVRTTGGHFTLWPNHARIITAMTGLGFSPLPGILWRKPTNAPNKFMGSGMLPAGAYVTLEHEHILIFRKGDKREFRTAEQKARRRISSFFWEERNLWFSDVWMELRGTRQALADKEIRNRSGAFPLELAQRLILMFSLAGDLVLDPFLGTGTTTLAAMMTGRQSLGIERDESLGPVIRKRGNLAPDLGREMTAARLAAHGEFLRRREADGKPAPGHRSHHYGFPVVTRQEVDMLLPVIEAVSEPEPWTFTAVYEGGEMA